MITLPIDPVYYFIISVVVVQKAYDAGILLNAPPSICDWLLGNLCIGISLSQ